MSTEEKKSVEKTENIPVKVEKTPVKAERKIRPRRNVPTTAIVESFDDLLDDFRTRFFESFWAPWEWGWEWPVTSIREAYSDLVDEGSKYLVRAEVPGIPRNKIDVTVTKDGIEISGETGIEKEEKEKNFVVRERSYSSIYKNLAFPEEVIPEKAECKIKDGVLEVSIPKKTPTPEVKKHKVEVKEAK